MRKRLLKDRLARLVLGSFAWCAVLILLGIFLMLSINALRLVFNIGLADFFSVNWNPSAYENPHFGIGSMLISTGLITILAMLIAVPIGIGAAACLSEILPPQVRVWIKPIIEMLAAVPSVVVGFLGIVLLGPFLAEVFNLPNGLNALNGAILLAVMSLPTIITVAEDVIHSVSKDYKEASYALGGNKWVTLVRVTLPACYSGLFAAVMLGMGRAVGETMTVLMVTGNATSVPHGIFDPVRTLTATIAIEMGEVPFNSQHYYSLFACGLVLFLLTLGANILAENIAAKLRNK